MVSTPSVPSATQTADTQAQYNQASAISSANLNHVNQVTPYGNLTYSQTGTNADGTPQYTATTALSSGEQGLLNTDIANQQNTANTASTLGQQVQSNLSSPLDFSQQRDYLNNLTNSNLDYASTRQQNQLNQSLANQGIAPGSEAYQDAQRTLITNQDQGYNNANLANFTTAQQSQQALRDLPLNELSALNANSQVQSPQFTNTGSTSVQPTDYSNLVNNQYNQQLGQANATNSTIGSIGTSLLSLLLSDKRVKTDIHDTGMKTPDNIPVKTFAYKGSPLMQMGVIAQDVEKKRPDAVKTGPDGYKRVDYGKVGSPMLMLGAKRKVA